MKPLHALFVALPILGLACATDSAPHAARAVAPAARSSEPWAESPLAHVTSIRDGRTGARLEFAELVEALAEADAVFLGETHLDETTHRFELAVYEALLARRDGRVVLAMEMFERDVQAALDAYLAGTIDEPTFLARSRPWSNYPTAYRRLIEHAKLHGAPVVASNFPATLRRKVTDAAAVLALTPEERAFVPARFEPNTPNYWRRVDNAIRGHAAMMGGGGGGTPADEARLFDTQSLWDNSMGEACALALEANPGKSVLHVNGGFHTEYHDGTARQFMVRRPGARTKTVAIVPSTSPFSAEIGGLPVADYVVFAEMRATDVEDGTHGVMTSRSLRYQLHVPRSATLAARVPLLVWLADDGETARDALDLWRARLGDTCAVAVIEAPYRETQEDLVEGGRWYWNDTFRHDIAPLRAGVLGAWGYLLRNLPIDPARVVIAGEGTGATVVAATTMLSDDAPIHGIAHAPRRYAQLKDFPLPLPELRGDVPPAPRRLDVVVRASDEAWWRSEVAEYRGIGLAAELTATRTDPWEAERECEDRVRAALGLAARAASTEGPRRHRVVAGVREKAWARLEAVQLEKSGERVALFETAPADEVLTATSSAGPATARSSEITSAVRAEDYRAGGALLPRAAGAFGGTTLIVLPDALDAREVEAWEALAKDDPLNKASRFHRIVLARTSGDRALPVVLRELQEKSRKNVLIVPAAWCADGATMRALKRSAAAFEDTMTLAYRPGLGGLVAR